MRLKLLTGALLVVVAAVSLIALRALVRVPAEGASWVADGVLVVQVPGQARPDAEGGFDWEAYNDSLRFLMVPAWAPVLATFFLAGMGLLVMAWAQSLATNAWVVAVAGSLTVAIPAVLLVPRGGDAFVALGTLALASASYAQLRDHRDERKRRDQPNLKWKDLDLTKGGDLHLRMIANLGHHPALVRYVSVHDEAGARFAHAFVKPLGLRSGEVREPGSVRLREKAEHIDKDMYDDVPAVHVVRDDWWDRAAMARVVVQSAGSPGFDLHYWFPLRDRHIDDRHPMFSHGAAYLDQRLESKGRPTEDAEVGFDSHADE